MTRYEFDDRSALIVVDVQNDFADPGGSLYVAGGETAVDFINRHITAAAAGGAFVVYTQDWHPESTPHFAKDGGIWPVHCVAGTWGSELHPDLSVVGPSVRKGVGGEDGYSGFTVRDPQSGEQHVTALEGMLREGDIERAAVLGLATDYCVKSTALDAARLGFVTSLLADGIRAVNLAPGDGTRAVAEMVAAGISVV
jgi:nicotinamidase/pyrazinamidase